MYWGNLCRKLTNFTSIGFNTLGLALNGLILPTPLIIKMEPTGSIYHAYCPIRSHMDRYMHNSTIPEPKKIKHGSIMGKKTPMSRGSKHNCSGLAAIYAGRV